SSGSSGSSQKFTNIISVILKQFIDIFDRIKGANDYSLDQICAVVSVDILSRLGMGVIGKDTIKGFYRKDNISSKNLEKIGTWVDHTHLHRFKLSEDDCPSDTTVKSVGKGVVETVVLDDDGHLHPTNEFKEKIHRFINSAIAIQRIWRAFKLGPETWVQRVWNIVRNDGTPDRKRFLGELPSFQRIIINPETQEEYALRVGEFVDGFMKNCIYIENFNLAELVTPGPRTILK
ncbi:9766_t:CDS:2, partial [Rhizophagus irregularis]